MNHPTAKAGSPPASPESSTPPPAVLVGVDTGGTFTDLVVWDGKSLRHGKVLSTPDDPSKAIIEGLERLGVRDMPLQLVHGTTVGTNAVLESKGVRVAYVTSRGFGDVLTLARQNRRQVYALEQPPEAPPVASELCLEVDTRIDAHGGLLARADGEALQSLAAQVKHLGAESVAVNLLFSFLRPEEEQRIAAALPEGCFVSCSSMLLPELREFERGIATWLNAAVGPLMARYLDELTRLLPRSRLSVMQSAGTTIMASQAAEQAVRLLLSGPAGGIAAARLLGKVSGHEQVMTLDMGGTSTDVSLLNGAIPLTNRSQIAGWPLTISTVDIHTIGAGGGSIARVDEGGMLLVGPESAGASPGPACYGQGGDQVTVTDANLILGRLPPDTLLGGYMPLQQGVALAALERLGLELGCGPVEAAQGVLRLANEHMARALRVMSVERGYDPRDYTLLCFGGAGGLHACAVAELLAMRTVIMPALAGVLSAQGMLASRPGRDLSRAVLKTLDACAAEGLQNDFEALRQEAEQALAAEGITAENLEHRRQLECRYLGQSEGLMLPWCELDKLEESFHLAHERASGHRLDRPVELVNLRLFSRGPAPVDDLHETLPTETDAPEAGTVYLPDMDQSVPVISRATLGDGATLQGPCIITDMAATTWVAPGWHASPDQWGNLVLHHKA